MKKMSPQTNAALGVVILGSLLAIFKVATAAR